MIVLVIAILVVLGLILAECPIALALLGGGSLGIVLLQDYPSASAVLANSPFTTSSSYELFVIPMYILLGALLSNAGIGEQIYRSVHRLTHRLPGGLAVSAVVATALFSGICGSSAADVAAFGRISVSEMARYKYSKGYAAAVVAAGGTFANLIPPSLGIVVYGIIAKESIGKLILAGVVPGVLSMVILAIFVYLRAVRSTAEAGFGGRLVSRAASPANGQVELLVHNLPGSWLSDSVGLAYGILIFGIVVGGLYGGFFTPTEAGAIGAFVALIIAALTPRSIRKKSFRHVIGVSLLETSRFTSMIFLLLVGGAVFSYFLALGGYATDLATWASGLNVPPHLLVALILLILLPLGIVLEGLAILLLAIPVFAPVVKELGFNGIWFGILALKVMEIGLIMPPFGINVFVSAGVNDMSPHVVFRQILPFAALDLGVTALLFAFPDIALWLPRIAGYP